MAWQMIKAILVLLAVFMPLIIAKIIFGKELSKWFDINENSFFSFGVPVTQEGYILSFVLIVIVVVLLILINLFI